MINGDTESLWGQRYFLEVNLELNVSTTYEPFYQTLLVAKISFHMMQKVISCYKNVLILAST